MKQRRCIRCEEVKILSMFPEERRAHRRPICHACFEETRFIREAKENPIPNVVESSYGVGPQGQLEQAYNQLSSLTKPRCGVKCGRPGFSCEPHFCEETIRHAQENFNVRLRRTKHPYLPLMGEYGCTAAPHLRPACTTHICEKHLEEDASFASTYRFLKAKVERLELKVNGSQSQQQEEDMSP